MKRVDDTLDWMWADALAALEQVERMKREFFQPVPAPAPTWEPPADVLETEHEVLIYVALPGVAADAVSAAIDGSALVVSGQRAPADALCRGAAVHRLELPYGRFRRRIPLPPGRYAVARVSTEYGCLVIRLQKIP
ncbi:MAG: Hsp20/alpha crystallin family protein [Ottowia sp.]